VKRNVNPIRVLHTLSGLHVAGVGRMLIRNAAALESDLVRNHIAYLTPNHHLEPEYRSAGFQPICVNHRRTADGPRTIYRLVRLIRELNVDVVHTNHSLDRLYGGLAARLAGVPALTTAHSTKRHYPFRGARLRLGLERRLLSRYLAVSSAVAHAFESSRGVRPDRIRLIYTGIDLRDFAQSVTADAASELRTQLGLLDDGPILINVGRLHPTKGQHHLIPMMSLILRRWPRAKLLVAGSGGARRSLEAAIAAAGLGDSIKLLGLRSDVRELLALSAVFVFPSTEEGLPIAVLEAMAAAKPVVAVRVAPLTEMVEDQNSGLLVSPNDPAALAAAVEQMLGSPESAARMGQRGREIVAERFSINSTIDSMARLYREVLR
jgi:glycosyltransferase involved in cell wall biosynthesis